jgi:hypothetical protein
MIWRLHEGLGIPAESLIKGAGAGRLRLRGSAPGAAGSENRIMAQAMNFGTFDDIVVLEQTVGKNRLVKVMLRPEPGWLSDRSWEFWRGRLSFAAGGAIPEEAPRRSLYAAAP